MEPKSPLSIDPAGQPMAATGIQPGPSLASPQAAEDTDLIEPEWVDAVKKVMAQYSDDPYNMAQAMTKLREDYLTKRYGRHIEAAE